MSQAWTAGKPSALTTNGHGNYVAYINGHQRRNALSALPEELLGHIFCMHVYDPDPFLPAEWTAIEFNPIRARAPFSVAAVCRSWRAAALSTPQVWHYVGVPAIRHLPVKARNALLRYVDTILHRSCDKGLVVTVGQIYDPEDPTVLAILDRLSRHMTRWRKLTLIFAEGTTSLSRVLDFFRGPAPRLEMFRLVQPPKFDPLSDLTWPTPLPDYFTGCINLKESLVLNVPVAFNAGTDLRALRHLVVLAPNIPCTLLWSMFRSAPLLEQLWLKYNVTNSSDGGSVREMKPPSAIRLDNVHDLGLFYESPCTIAQYPDALDLPKLRTMTTELPVANTLRSLAVFLERCSDSLEKLTLQYGIIDANDLQSLRPLRRLESLYFNACSVPVLLFDMLRDAMPMLAHVSLARVSIEPEGSDAVLELVRFKNTCDGTGDRKVKRFRTFDIDEQTNVSSDVKAEIARLLRPPCGGIHVLYTKELR
ncbi:hypothetical protein EXIGLDRAFT_726219 [Exidia glandulosa HHB12029]|uniref:Uncharacterized protein n=1 Tax=Exidia glandulosa HHB12029 TaxID=1314781 RepID=A0A165MEC1_EXIGL|nr:hypothetical protein EXIGLDRAFT_726219 [Exidia glandulosa HHB12029]